MVNNKKAITKKDKEFIEKGLDKAGKRALKDALEGKIPEEAIRMGKRLDKLDKFIQNLVMEEGVEILDPFTVIEMLMIKARHYGFQYTEDTHPYAVVVWLINILTFQADQVFAVTKAHLIQEEKQKKKKKNEL